MMKYAVLALMIVVSCAQVKENKIDNVEVENESLLVDVQQLVDINGVFENVGKTIRMDSIGELSFDLLVQNAGRYKVTVNTQECDNAQFWIEDYVDNMDNRAYNVSGDISIQKEDCSGSVEGLPLKEGLHKMKIHFTSGTVNLQSLSFTKIRSYESTPVTFTQSTEGESESWEIVWADEFDQVNIDTAKWVYDLGDWGWGNNELQYYTENDTQNARIEDGFLVIEARKSQDDNKWTSARLTTRGRESFLYGKIEFRAKVPHGRGNWAAGWTLGDSYIDELDWPYCGEIDILESVGYEVNDSTSDGIAHATVHTPAYYFKINNQISSVIDVKDIAKEFHTYAVIWTPSSVVGLVDGKEYYMYDKTANEMEWPFNDPQNIILNLAMGGGWGGAHGMDSTIQSQKFIIDYVRVYGNK
ncbi:MAG: glycoside hydrolase family 16 protein [Reichenbachiella sp.]